MWTVHDQENQWGVPREQIAWYPTIISNKCTNCNICLDFCPHGVYSLDENAVKVENPYNCIVACNKCQSLCPTEAIAFPDMDDLMMQLVVLRQGQSVCGCNCSKK